MESVEEEEEHSQEDHDDENGDAEERLLERPRDVAVQVLVGEGTDSFLVDF